MARLRSRRPLAFVFALLILPFTQVPSAFAHHGDPHPITVSLAGTFGEGGWYISDVTVTITIVDDGVPPEDKAQYKLDYAETWTTYTSPFVVSGDGSHNVETRIIPDDGWGRDKMTYNTSVPIDSTPPVTTHAFSGTPGKGGWFVSAVTTTLTATDTYSGVKETRYRIGAAEWSVYGSPFTLSADGAYAIDYYSKDVAGATEATRSATLDIDATAPDLSASILETPVGGWYKDSVTLQATATDATSGIAETRYRLNGGAWVVLEGELATFSEEGDHTLEVEAEDEAGNVRPADAFSIPIDVHAPTTTLSLDGPVGKNGWYVGDVTATFSATDSASGVSRTLVKVNDGEERETPGTEVLPADGDYTLAYRSVDVVGHEEDSASIGIRVDGTSPTLTATPPEELIGGWYRDSVTIAVSASDATSGVVDTRYRLDAGSWTPVEDGQVVISEEGEHTLEVEAEDEAGNVRAVETLTLKVDSGLPATQLSLDGPAGLNGWYVGDVTATFTASDSASGVDRTLVKINDGEERETPGTEVLPADGRYTLSYRSVDVVGHEEAASSVDVLIDGTAPATTLSLDGTLRDGWFTSAVTVTLSATDGDGSGVDATRYTLDGGDEALYANPFVVDADGVHTILFRSTDVAGHEEASSSTEVRVDMLPPTTRLALSGTEGANGWYTSDVTVTLTAEDAGIGIASTTYTLDGGDPVTYTGPFVLAGSDGTRTVRFFSTDLFGHEEAESSREVKIDATLPTTTHTLTGTLRNGWYRSAVRVALSGTDEGGSRLDETRYALDGGAEKRYSAAFDVTGDGAHSVKYHSKDLAGNVEPTQEATFKIDTVAPVTTATLTGTLGWNGWYRSPVTVSLAATDARSGVEETTRKVTGGVHEPYTDPLHFPGPAWLNVTYTSTDFAGNVEAERKSEIKIDLTPPTTTTTLDGQRIPPGAIGPLTVEENTFLGPVIVKLAAVDDRSGVRQIMYQIDQQSWRRYAEDPIVVVPGRHTVTVQAQDYAGNWEAYQVTEFIVIADVG